MVHRLEETGSQKWLKEMRSQEWRRIWTNQGSYIVYEVSKIFDCKEEDQASFFYGGIKETEDALGEVAFIYESEIKKIGDIVPLEELLTHRNELVRRHAKLLLPNPS